MSTDKKLIRQRFRDDVFSRDGNKCRCCGWSVFVDGLVLDAHHITDRKLIPKGGYVKENGIALCPGCHEKAEVFHVTGHPLHNYSPEDLNKLIGSSYELAHAASERLK